MFPIVIQEICDQALHAQGLLYHFSLVLLRFKAGWTIGIPQLSSAREFAGHL
jgi:hypothetical protein